jgi:hypothetical protein
MRKRETRAFLPVALFATLALVMRTAAADTLKPFEISYTWDYRPFGTVAVSTLKLKHSDGDTWVYSSSSVPRGIGRVFQERPTMESVMRVTRAGVQPLSYRATANTSSKEKDIDLKFDWGRHRVTGVYEGTPVDMALQPGTQDDLSVQIALMVELLRGHSPDRFLLLDKSSTREYRYTRENTASLDTPLGAIATIVYLSSKEGSPRETRFWCAPDRGYIPMKVEQKSGDNIQWTMQLQTFKRD